MNKLRLKFTKNGPIKFIGHLDVMRYFQKAIRRADIDIKYSEGFSPHQILSFAQPLSVGATSDGEYLDMTVNSMSSKEDIMERLNTVMNEGITITAIRELPDKSPNAMTASYAARYLVRFRDSFKPDFDVKKSFEEFLLQDKIFAVKKTKSGEKEIDIKPLIFEYKVNDDGSFEFLLSMNSTSTLKVALLFDSFFKSIDREFDPLMIAVHRVDIYTGGEDEKGFYIEPFIPDCADERVYLNV